MKHTTSLHSFAKWLTLLTVAMAVFFSTAAQAATLFSNLGQGNTVQGNFNDTNDLWASDFLTNGSASTITGTTISLGNFGGDGTHTYTVSIYTDVSGKPGTSVGSFSVITAPQNFSGLINYSATSGGINLSANTTYWEVVKMNENDPFAIGGQWGSTTNNSTDAGSVFTTISGTTMKESINNGSTWGGSNPGNFQFSLTGTQAAPEPGRGLLMLAGAGMALLRRRRSLTV